MFGMIYGIFKVVLNTKVLYLIRKELEPDEDQQFKVDHVWFVSFATYEMQRQKMY